MGFLPQVSRHGFFIHVPKGSAKGDVIWVSEYRGGDRFSGAAITDLPVPPLSGPSLRVAIDRGRWAELAPAFWEEANRRLRVNGVPTFKLMKSPSKPIPAHPSLGKELCVPCWAAAEATIDDITNALCNWEALAPEKRWRLYTMTVATPARRSRRGWAGPRPCGPPLLTTPS